MRSASGAASASGTSPFARAAAPKSAAAAGKYRPSRLATQGSASSIAAENVAVSEQVRHARLAEPDPRDRAAQNQCRHRGRAAAELPPQDHQ